MEELIKSISWPHVTLLFSLIFIVMFRKQIGNLIQRTTKINKEGLFAEQSPETQREKKNSSPEAVQQLLDAVGNSIVIREQENNIRKDLMDRGLPVEGDCTKVLIKHLAGTQILLAFERIHSMIFGSQIILLKMLNEVPGQGRGESFIKGFVNKIRETYPEQLGSWSHEQYLDFLYNQVLITRQGERYHITNLGVEYLTWITRTGRSENNPL